MYLGYICIYIQMPMYMCVYMHMTITTINVERGHGFKEIKQGGVYRSLGGREGLEE